jgi:hypothetical protein
LIWNNIFQQHDQVEKDEVGEFNKVRKGFPGQALASGGAFPDHRASWSAAAHDTMSDLTGTEAQVD